MLRSAVAYGRYIESAQLLASAADGERTVLVSPSFQLEVGKAGGRSRIQLRRVLWSFLSEARKVSSERSETTVDEEDKREEREKGGRRRRFRCGITTILHCTTAPLERPYRSTSPLSFAARQAIRNSLLTNFLASLENVLSSLAPSSSLSFPCFLPLL